MKDKQPAVKKGSLPAILVISLIIFMFTGVLVYAAYSQRGLVKEDYLGANKDFHFYSDLLGSDGTIPEYHITRDWDDISTGDTLFSFEIRNYKDDLNISSAPISYTIKYYVDGILKDTSNDAFSANAGKSENSVEYGYETYITLGSTVIIEATSSSPYVKTLKAKLIFAELPEIFSWSMDDNDGEPVAVLHMELE